MVEEELRECFGKHVREFAKVGDRKTEMDEAAWWACIENSGLRGEAIRDTDVDTIFASVTPRTSKVMTFDQFKEGLLKLGDKKHGGRDCFDHNEFFRKFIYNEPEQKQERDKCGCRSM